MLTKLSSLLDTVRPLKYIKAWQKAAGPIFIKQAKFMGVHPSKEGRLLVVEIKDPLWKEEFKYYKDELLAQYIKALKEFGFSDSELPVKAELLSSLRKSPSKSTHPQKTGNKKTV